MTELINHLFFEENKFLKPHNLIKISLLVLIIGFAVFVTLNYTLDDVQTFIQQNKSQALLISLIVYMLFGLTFLPSVPLTLFLAVLIGPLQAAIVAAVGNTSAAFLEYQVGKTIGDVVDFDDLKAKLPFGLGKLPIKSPYFLLAIRSIPAGTRSFSVVCGAYHVPIGAYMWTTFTMYTLSSIFLAYGGVEILRLL